MRRSRFSNKFESIQGRYYNDSSAKPQVSGNTSRHQNYKNRLVEFGNNKAVECSSDWRKAVAVDPRLCAYAGELK